jgi:4'-phosphopantetheinyl transferase
MPKGDSAFFLWWASPEVARHYRRDRLRAADQARAEVARSPRAERDWRVSRALLWQASATWPPGADPAISITHSRGHAAVAAAPAAWRIGVDLEAMRPRDVAALAEWCCTAEEQAALAACSGVTRLRVFYVLWTLKEAFVKAAGLRFPADMRTVGLLPSGDPSAEPGGWRLRAPAGPWRAYAAVLDGGWVVSVVWRVPGDGVASARTGELPRDNAAPAWRAGPDVPLPRVEAAWRWD